MATVEIPTHQKVLSFVGALRKMLIVGKWLEAASGKTFPTYNPATGEVLAHVAEGNSADIGRAVLAARKAFEIGPWRLLTATERGRLIWTPNFSNLTWKNSLNWNRSTTENRSAWPARRGADN